MGVIQLKTRHPHRALLSKKQEMFVFIFCAFLKYLLLQHIFHPPVNICYSFFPDFSPKKSVCKSLQQE